MSDFQPYIHNSSLGADSQVYPNAVQDWLDVGVVGNLQNGLGFHYGIETTTDESGKTYAYGTLAAYNGIVFIAETDSPTFPSTNPAKYEDFQGFIVPDWSWARALLPLVGFANSRRIEGTVHRSMFGENGTARMIVFRGFSSAKYFVAKGLSQKTVAEGFFATPLFLLPGISALEIKYISSETYRYGN